jgi:non-ribosomal peptide synthetase component F
MIGVFINTIALRINHLEAPGFDEMLRQVRDTCLAAYANQDLPFERLVEELKPQRDLSRTPIFQVVFNLQNAPLPELRIPGLEVGFEDLDRGISQFDLTLMMSKLRGQIHATVEYNKDLFDEATIARMFRSFELLLQDAVANPSQLISKLLILSKAECHHLIHGLNQTRLEFPREKCMHQLFEEQVEKTPDAMAIMHNDTSLTYLDLNRRANKLANQLCGCGVGRGIRVGIMMEKTFETVIALLAVHKAGATYVPIHPSFPVQRVQFILKDVGALVFAHQCGFGFIIQQ